MTTADKARALIEAAEKATEMPWNGRLFNDVPEILRWALRLEEENKALRKSIEADQALIALKDED